MKRRSPGVDRQRQFRLRSYLVGFCMAAGAAILLGRGIQLQVVESDFLQRQANARQVRTVELSANRGMITDRHGQPLAVSTPVDSVWADPADLAQAPEHIPELARLLQLDRDALAARLAANVGRNFLYLKRHMNPADAERVAQARIPGVHLQREYRRFYPAGEVTAHLIGFANVDDTGQEGIELAFDHRLAGKPGKKRVLRDRRGYIVEDIEQLQAPEPGQPVALSIDLRIQYLAYRELKKSIHEHKASSGSVVVLDVRTGEVLAMAVQPGFNPNDRAQYRPSRYRNRAITDMLEPGSSLKPLVVAAAIESGKFSSRSQVNTHPGYLQIGAKRIEDLQNHGQIGLDVLLAKSSNVGASRLALDMAPAQLWDVLTAFGLGRTTASGFPGESAGLLSHHSNWRPISQATLGYGYGISVTPLQLAQAYAVFGSDGLARPVSLVRVDKTPIPRRVISGETAEAVLHMMERVVGSEGTGSRAAVPGYRVVGKTGTTRRNAAGGYTTNRYTATFAGLAPLSAPRLAVVVVIDEPSAGEYYGGQVAAPVFARVIDGATRILALPPDAVQAVPGSTVTVALGR